MIVARVFKWLDFLLLSSLFFFFFVGLLSQLFGITCGVRSDISEMFVLFSRRIASGTVRVSYDTYQWRLLRLSLISDQSIFHCHNSHFLFFTHELDHLTAYYLAVLTNQRWARAVQLFWGSSPIKCKFARSWHLAFGRTHLSVVLAFVN